MADGNFSDAAPALILLSGVPGAGKTTFAHALQRRLSFTHGESDRVRSTLTRRPVFSPGEHAALFAIVERRARDAIARGSHALVDATNLTTRDRRRFLRMAEELALTLVAVRVVAPAETIRERLTTPRTGFSTAGVEVFERMSARPQPFTIPVVVVDSRFPLDPALELLNQLVESGCTRPQ
jgi:predicted kinase